MKKFEYIDEVTFQKLSSEQQKEIIEYRSVSGLIKRKQNSIERKREQIKSQQHEIKQLKKQKTKLLKEVKIYSENYNPIISIVPLILHVLSLIVRVHFEIVRTWHAIQALQGWDFLQHKGFFDLNDLLNFDLNEMLIRNDCIYI